MAETLTEMVGTIWSKCDAWTKQHQNTAFAVSMEFSANDPYRSFEIPYALMREIAAGFLKMKSTLDQLAANENKRQQDIADHQANFRHIKWHVGQPLNLRSGETVLLTIVDGPPCTRTKDPLFINPIGDVDLIDFKNAVFSDKKQEAQSNG